jgi:hypothetical protein
VQTYQPKKAFSKNFQAIRNVIIARDENPIFDGSALPDDALKWVIERKNWLRNNSYILSTFFRLSQRYMSPS